MTDDDPANPQGHARQGWKGLDKKLVENLRKFGVKRGQSENFQQQLVFISLHLCRKTPLKILKRSKPVSGRPPTSCAPTPS
jgi:hypothetical protein